jgi:hypothetical protein
MQNLSTNQAIKSSNGGVIDNGNTSGNPQVSAPGGPGNYAESDGSNRYQFQTGRGYEGPGKGNARVLNSDDQMPPNGIGGF